jgi:hypothetical protein
LRVHSSKTTTSHDLPGSCDSGQLTIGIDGVLRRRVDPPAVKTALPPWPFGSAGNLTPTKNQYRSLNALPHKIIYIRWETSPKSSILQGLPR